MIEVTQCYAAEESFLTLTADGSRCAFSRLEHSGMDRGYRPWKMRLVSCRDELSACILT